MATQDAASSSVGTLSQDDVVQLSSARAVIKHEDPSKLADGEIPPKKRKTRRGKCKRRNVHPYKNELKTNKVIKPEAPYNSNRFLIEDHGTSDGIEQLKNVDQISISTVTRTRDSSFSVDSDAEFYSTPDDEEEFLIKDFDDQYESLQAERLHTMTKDELIEEYLQLESKVESLTKRLRCRITGFENDNSEGNSNDVNNAQQVVNFQSEIDRLKVENESLRRENETLKSKQDSSSDSEDSETDSSDSCSSTSSSSISRPSSPIDCPQTNGHSPTIIEEAI